MVTRSWTASNEASARVGTLQSVPAVRTCCRQEPPNPRPPASNRRRPSRSVRNIPRSSRNSSPRSPASRSSTRAKVHAAEVVTTGFRRRDADAVRRITRRDRHNDRVRGSRLRLFASLLPSPRTISPATRIRFMRVFMCSPLLFVGHIDEFINSTSLHLKGFTVLGCINRLRVFCAAGLWSGRRQHLKRRRFFDVPGNPDGPA